MALDPDKHRLSEAKHQAVFETLIVPELFAKAVAQSSPVAIVFGGQPGAGKSVAVDRAVLELRQRGGSAEIIGDDLRPFHPKFKQLMQQDDKTAAFYTDRDTGRWVEKAIDYAAKHRFNVVIEGTMRNPDAVAKTLSSFRAAGYETDARALAVNERLSWQGVMQRYEAQKADRGNARMTAPHSHADAYAGVPVTLERIERDRLADRVSLYRRSGAVIYSNELVNGQWKAPAQARQALEAERARPFSLAERTAYAQGFDKLAELVARPARGALPQEVQAIETLRRQAGRELLAEVLRQSPAVQGIKSHPELAPAYAALAELGRRADARGLTPDQRQVLVSRAREELAKDIEQGRQPEVRRRVDPSRGPADDLDR